MQMNYPSSRRSKPWTYPNKFLKVNKEYLHYLARVVAHYNQGNSPLLDELIWQAGRLMPDDRNFQKSRVREEAEVLARRLNFTLRPQLSKLGIRKPGNAATEFWEDCNDKLLDVFQRALTLKGLLLTAAEEYELMWVAPGVEVDRTTMKEVCIGREAYDVTFCVSSMVRARAHPDEEWRVVSPATVHSF